MCVTPDRVVRPDYEVAASTLGNPKVDRISEVPRSGFSWCSCMGGFSAYTAPLPTMRVRPNKTGGSQNRDLSDPIAFAPNGATCLGVMLLGFVPRSDRPFETSGK